MESQTHLLLTTCLFAQNFRIVTTEQHQTRVQQCQRTATSLSSVFAFLWHLPVLCCRSPGWWARIHSSRIRCCSSIQSCFVCQSQFQACCSPHLFYYNSPTSCLLHVIFLLLLLLFFHSLQFSLSHSPAVPPSCHGAHHCPYSTATDTGTSPTATYSLQEITVIPAVLHTMAVGGHLLNN